MRQVTVTEHLLLHQTKSPAATGQFTRLLYDLILSAKIVSSNVNSAGLLNVLGATGSVNVQGEMVQKLDEIANKTLIHRMERAGVLAAMASEENADVILIPDRFTKGDYLLIFDPLDGSSNIDVNIDVGTIFSIFRRTRPSSVEVTAQDFLRPGYEQVAAGYFLYGPSTMLVYTTGQGVHGFTLDPSVGEFLLSHPDIRVPVQGKIYSVNESNWMYWDEPTRQAVTDFKTCNNDLGRPYSMRYVGSVVADFHRTLLYGGIFMYPKDYENPDDPHGKLRLLCEASPLAFLAEQAGGLASTGTRRVLDIVPKTLHERTPLFIGSAADVGRVISIFQNARVEERQE